MRFTKIQGVLVNLETVSKIEKYECQLRITLTNGSMDKYFFHDRAEVKAEFERLEQLICEI